MNLHCPCYELLSCIEAMAINGNVPAGHSRFANIFWADGNMQMFLQKVLHLEDDNQSQQPAISYKFHLQILSVSIGCTRSKPFV